MRSKKIVKKQHGMRPCWLCGTLHGDWSEKYVHCHHIFNGPNRHFSEEYGHEKFMEIFGKNYL